MSMAIDWDGNFVLASSKNQDHVMVLDPSGSKIIRTFAHEGCEDGQMLNPQCVTIGRNGTIVTSDFGTDRIQVRVFPLTQSFLNLLVGAARSHALCAFSVLLDPDEMQEFTADGKFIGKCDSYGKSGDRINGPVGVDVNHNNGEFIIAEYSHQRVSIFNSTYQFVRILAGSLSENGIINTFDSVWSVAVDSEGTILVSDIQTRVIRVFQEDGKLLSQFGSSDNFLSPVSMSISHNGDVFVIENQPTHKIPHREWIKRFG